MLLEFSCIVEEIGKKLLVPYKEKEMQEQQRKFRWNTIVKNGSVSLMRGDRYVQALSTRLGWREETLIRRAQAALPRKLDQELFLNLMIDILAPVHPETFRNIYHYFTDGQWMSFGMDREVGDNLYANRSERIVHQMELTLGILHWEKEEGYMIDWLSAAHLVYAYGDDAEDVLGLIAEYLHEIIDTRNMRMSTKKAFAVIAKIVADRAANADGMCGAPNIASVEDIIELLSPLPSGWEADAEEDG